MGAGEGGSADRALIPARAVSNHQFVLLVVCFRMVQATCGSSGYHTGYSSRSIAAVGSDIKLVAQSGQHLPGRPIIKCANEPYCATFHSYLTSKGGFAT